MSMLRKSGDRGYSDLFSGERISKNSARLEALGDLDELGCVLAVARHHARNPSTKKRILNIQQDLFVLGTELATTDNRKKISSQGVDKPFLVLFEKTIEALYQSTSIPPGFIIPGDSLSAAYLHLARTVARRCERHVVRLYELKQMTNVNILSWLNRLSVYLYLLVIQEEKKLRLVKRL
mgnify:CR=1 FL=1